MYQSAFISRLRNSANMSPQDEVSLNSLKDRDPHKQVCVCLYILFIMYTDIYAYIMYTDIYAYISVSLNTLNSLKDREPHKQVCACIYCLYVIIYVYTYICVLISVP